MADDKVLESESEAQEETGSPTPPPSIPSIDEQPSAQSPNVEDIASATAEKLRPMIRQEVDRTFQSGKDVRYASVEKIHKYLEAADGDVGKATRDMKLDEIYERLDSEAAAGTAAQGSDSQEKFAQAKTQLALDDAGIPYDDPAYVLLVAQYGTLPADQWINIAETWAGQEKNKRAKQENIPGAAAASEGGTVISVEGDEDIESLAQELDKLMALPVPVSAETMVARKEVRQKLKARQDEAGLLDNIRITK
jgi:flagellar motor switch/type III secretory pathway protein FliN